MPVTITANDGVNSSTVTFNMTANTFAAGRSAFYNNATGANLSNAGAANNAIDTSKSVLRTPGAVSTFANYTNYSRGLNGLIVDIAGLPTTVTNAQMLASLQFAHWNAISAGGFAALPVAAVPTVTIISNSGVGGSARIKITFPDNTLRNTWLRVIVLANTTTGLATNDVFYFGNVIGDLGVGNTPTRLRVNATDTAAVRSNQSTAANSASVTNIYDINRDGRVNATDTALIRSNQQTGGILAPLTVPSNAPPAGAAPANGSGGKTAGSDDGGKGNVGEGEQSLVGTFEITAPIVALTKSSDVPFHSEDDEARLLEDRSLTIENQVRSFSGSILPDTNALNLTEIVQSIALTRNKKQNDTKDLTRRLNDDFFASLGRQEW